MTSIVSISTTDARRAFNEMRGRHAEMFVVDKKRRATICIPDSKEETATEETEETDSDTDN